MMVAQPLPASTDFRLQADMEMMMAKHQAKAALRLGLIGRWIPAPMSLSQATGPNWRAMMEEQDIRAAIARHWAASAAGDLVAEHEIYHDDAVCEYPQSGEVIHGRRNLQSLRSHHPGRPSGFVIRRIAGEGNLWITEYVITYQTRRSFTVSIMNFRGEKVSHETQYFADPFDAPAWRSEWVEPKA